MTDEMIPLEACDRCFMVYEVGTMCPACKALTVFAIRHKPTGKFMPCRMTRCGFGGWSWWVPTGKPEGFQKPFDENPRVFFTRQAARNALTAWLQGAWRQEERTEGFEYPESYTELVPEEPPVPRVRDDMEIVTFDLTERTS